MDNCMKCEGKGYLIRGGIIFRCQKCGGRGELDWIEQVMGRDNDIKIPTIDQLLDKEKSDRISAIVLKKMQEESILYQWMKVNENKQ